MAGLAAVYADHARRGDMSEPVRIVIQANAAYPDGLLDLAAALLLEAARRCPPGLRHGATPDLSRLAPSRPDALTVLKAASDTKRLLGRGPVDADDITSTEQQVSTHEAHRPTVQAALAAASRGLNAVRAALGPADADPRAVSAVLAMAAEALRTIG
ncbi:hypothetical protein ACFY4B_27000 [Kitasatospora sp. NPDC001261]|uniref:hypothetical protein n=1 Tax=Kitasatospora sp. NPDC001261 TaxID=3364012 RepID=UPI0036A3419F